MANRTTATLAAGVLLACGLAVPQVATAAPATHSCSRWVNIESFSDALDKTNFNGAYVGNFSALSAAPDGDILALSDRSELFSLDRTTKQPVDVVPLADEQGRPLDSEGLAIDPDGTRLITSEVEPSVRRYAPDGTLLGDLPVPDVLRVAPAGRSTENATFEGLTLQPGGRTLVASMEDALSGDQADLVRFQTWSRGSAGFTLADQYGYQVDQGLGVAEVTAVGDGRLLVLERGFTEGVGNTIRLYLADPHGATDVTGIDSLTSSDARLVHKTPLVDLQGCPTLGATAKQPQPNPLLDNIEGMTVQHEAPGGRLQVLLVSDDNENPVQTTRLYSLDIKLPHH
ncbi:esterase-like activity of phytase family protein [Saccharopolyspora sp. K220]|uniref:esterase-like activity of phytase family protein n=1 Tax=Saccharopolyspora soli TaxID=2926618 RepID=UPI001F573F7E|nr:esterase-like activity of phytase family protein [Saccharopolyspora soli]MCI2418708.1 esterase-like activity of phytase family protein [Saccharopolyspora soli]